MNNFSFSSHFPVPKMQYYNNHHNQLDSDADITRMESNFPAFKEYKAATKCLNPQHVSHYGDQDLFQKGTRRSVALVLSKLEQGYGYDEYECVVYWFDNLLSRIGDMRKEIAYSSHPGSEFNKLYGKARTDDPLTTPLKDAYSAYLDKFLKYVEKNHERNKDLFQGKAVCNVIISIDEQMNKTTIPLTSLDEDHENIDNVYETFWEGGDDPVFRLTVQSYKDIIDGKNLSPDELKDKIADFHWLFANICPFLRGSAWCGEVLTDAAWLLHGYVPTPIEHGKSLDLEAMSSSQEDFRNIYPMGHRV